MPKRLLLLLALAAVVAGAVLRWQHIDSRPLHTDEAVQAWQTWRLLKGEGYRYDPVDRHGPWLYYGAATLERIRGGDASSFNDRHARTFAWIAGVLTLGLVAFWGGRLLGAPEAAAATLLLAVSPLAVLYQTYFVQEAWLALFTWMLLLLGLRWIERPRLSLAVATGVVAGLVQATKETSVIHFAALVIALAAARITTVRTGAVGPSNSVFGSLHARDGRRRKLIIHASAATAVALLVYALFYSGFGSNPAGLVDGVSTYFHQWKRSSDATHSHPFFHYINLLLPHTSGGLRWGEPWLLVLAVVGAVLGLRRTASPAWRAITVFTIALLLIYSAIPYKTPWLLLTPMIGLTLLAGLAVGRLARLGGWPAAAAGILAVLATLQLMDRTTLALDRYPGDPRNPYFYQQTPRSFEKLEQRLRELSEFAPAIAIVSPDHGWPLPWYLRGYKRAGYFTTPPASLDRYDLILWDSQVEPPAAWPEDSMVEVHSLRPNVLLHAVIRRELWSQWEQAHLHETDAENQAP